MTNAANPEEIKKAEVKQKSKLDQEVDDLVWVLSTKQGRRFIWKWLSHCGVFQSSVHNSGSMTYFNEGQRNVGLKLFSEITEYLPESYLLAMKESREV